MCVCGYCIMYMNHIYIRFYKCVGYKCENQIEVVPKREWCDVGMTVSGTKMKKKISHLYTFTVSIGDNMRSRVCVFIYIPPTNPAGWLRSNKAVCWRLNLCSISIRASAMSPKSFQRRFVGAYKSKRTVMGCSSNRGYRLNHVVSVLK